MINPIRAYRHWVGGYVNRLHMLSGYDFNRDFVIVITTYTPFIIIALIMAYVLIPIITLRDILLIVTTVLLIDYLSVLVYMNAKVYVRTSHFERYLANTLMIMTPLVASGVTLEELIDTLAIIERDPYIAREFKIILKDAREGGMDILTALRASLNRVPSRTYNEVFSLITETYLISANLADILMLKLEYLVRNKYNKLRSATQVLSLFMEVYLVTALLLPILLVLIIVTISPLGPIYLGSITLSPTLVLLITTLIYSPVMGYVMYLLIDSTISSIE
ncbi:type II secretion system protein [Vulcanisaeta moutnovskia 768-28]|uniref:Type II secretion system protein n=1 Tax=Vulcanisaeta moutnovskia (strain 768-28) TaxID=985053 RepID=F0QW58_VULM7|nr:type II secretion system F family protein [Vulcanisaeta moutnovskia]ADY02153.1 type II secretion system protein [Vulcanisaeta moutnovskia 768-28]